LKVEIPNNENHLGISNANENSQDSHRGLSPRIDKERTKTISVVGIHESIETASR